MKDEQHSSYLIQHFYRHKNRVSFDSDSELWTKESTKVFITELMDICSEDFVFDELKRRYWYKRKEGRLEILRFMLGYNEETRQWGYRKLQQHWYDECTDIICKLWESYGERVCTQLVAEHAPLEYVKKHARELAKGEYGCLCLRLGKEPDFQIDKKQLLPWEYLYIATKLKLEVSEEECELCLYQTMVDSMKNATLENRMYAAFDFESLSEDSREKIGMVTEYLCNNRKRKQMYHEYRKFCQRLYEETVRRLCKQRDAQHVPPAEITQCFIEVASEFFPDKYRWMIEEEDLSSTEDCPF